MIRILIFVFGIFKLSN